MAAVTKVAPSLASPVGENFIRRGEATEDIKVGQVVALDGVPSSARFEAAYSLAATTEVGIGIAIVGARAGEVVEVVMMGLVGGYAGLTPGDVLTVASGELDTTAGSSMFTAYNETTVLVGFYRGAATP